MNAYRNRPSLILGTDLPGSDQTYLPNLMKQKFKLSLNKRQRAVFKRDADATITETLEAISSKIGNVVH